MKLFVTGPQRSGSTFVSHCLAKSYDLKHIDEMEFDVYFLDWFYAVTKNLNDWVVHAPGLFSEILKVQERIPDVTFVIVKRSIEEINRSQEKINLDLSTEKIKLNIPESNKSSVALIKYIYWDRWKKHLSSWVEYDYRDFENHPMWVSESERKNFHPKQWKK